MIVFQQVNDTATIRISGRFDFRCVKQFSETLLQGPRSWIVDLAKVDYVDSAALGMLLLLREHAGGERALVTLRGANGQPRDVLLMAKFERMFQLEA